MTKKLETRQLIQSKLDNLVTEEGWLMNLMESKRNEILEVDEKKKTVEEKNLTLQKENEALAIDKVKLLDTMAALEAELEVKRSYLVGKDSQVAKELEMTRKKYGESQAEMEVVKKDFLETASMKEEVVKQLEEIELDIQSQKAVLSEKSKLEEKLWKEG